MIQKVFVVEAALLLALIALLKGLSGWMMTEGTKRMFRPDPVEEGEENHNKQMQTTKWQTRIDRFDMLCY